MSYDVEAAAEVAPVVKTISVVDVRDGEKERMLAYSIIKTLNANRGSKYIKPSFGSGGGCYNVSRKRR
jgi:hypothetical protein